jgi:iron complex outermembrane recepter protein
MTKTTELKRYQTGLRLALATGVSVLALSLGSAAFAQTADAAAPETTKEKAKDDTKKEEAIVVLGSRIKSDEFSSAVPVQTIDVEAARQLGAFSFDDYLQLGSTVNSGQQFDTTINNSFVTTNGPGTSNVSFRNLGADRTLVMINGRRFAPSGVGGAPSNPDLNLIPTLAIKNVTSLLDGAGAVYGSDAIAGVLDVEIDSEFVGLVTQARYTPTEEGGGNQYQFGFKAGARGDRGGYTLSVEYFKTENLTVADRPKSFTSRDDGRICNRDIEVDQTTGQISRDICQGGTIGALVVLPIRFQNPNGNFGFGGGGAFPAVRYSPGGNVFGVPDFAFVNAGVNGVGRDGDNPDIRDGANGFAQNEIFPNQKRFSSFFTADYDISPDVQFYSEISYSNVRGNSNGGRQQIFPTVSSSNPFNPFGDSTFGLPVTIIQFFNQVGFSENERNQIRMVGGLRGTMNFIGGWLGEWDYDIYGSYSRSIGVNRQDIILEDNLALSLDTAVRNPDGSVTCGNNRSVDFFGFISQETCVPLNVFDPNLFTNQTTDQAAIDFITGTLTTDTIVDETVISGFMTGELPITLPGGKVSMAIGGEWRNDGINTKGDTVRQRGQAAGRNLDRNSRGDLSHYEAFTEVVVPLMADKPLMESLVLRGAGRIVKSPFGTNGVYDGKLVYSPFSYLTFRGTAGKSFRSPNLNFVFLGGQSGFASPATDPCRSVPLNADGSDPRSQVVLDNCIADGIDPSNFNNPGFETFRAGADVSGVVLQPETSRSFTGGFNFKQPWTEAVGVELSGTFFNIKVMNGIRRASAGTILNTCYNSVGKTDSFCNAFTRDPVSRFITELNLAPENADSEISQGVDMAVRITKDFNLMDRNFDIFWVTSATRLIKDKLTTANGSSFDSLGNFGSEKWRATSNLAITSGDFGFQWSTQYRSKGVSNVLNPRPITSAARNSFDKDFLSSFFIHSASVSYYYDTWNFSFGVRNLLNRKPENVDNSFDSFGNAVFGTGQDFLGRRYTMGLTKSF